MKKMLGSFPRRIGNQLCFADLRPKKTWRIHKQPRSSSQALRRMKRHEKTTIPLLSPLTTRETRFLLRQGGQSPVDKPLRWNADVLQQLHPKNRAGKVDGNVLHVIGTAGN